MKNKIISLLILSASLYGAENGTQLFKKCAGCHGAKGEKVALGKSKIIKDIKKADFIKALQGYKAGTYGGAQKAVMQGQVKSLSDGQIKAIAAAIAK
jgi:cytochrome c